MYARLVRYEVGQPENAEGFIDAIMRRFDGMQHALPDMLGSFLLTRRDDGEALEITLWETAEAAQAAAATLDAGGVPETGAREVVVSRRGDTRATADDASSVELWDVWQGEQKWKADYEETPGHAG